MLHYKILFSIGGGLWLFFLPLKNAYKVILNSKLVSKLITMLTNIFTLILIDVNTNIYYLGSPMHHSTKIDKRLDNIEDL